MGYVVREDFPEGIHVAHDFNKNLYNLLYWQHFIDHSNSNGFLFQNQRGYHGPGPYDTTHPKDYSRLMHKCDLTGKRKEFNYNEMHKRYKERIYRSHELGFWGFCFGSKYANQLVDEYIGRGRLAPGEYPAWRCPVILEVAPELFSWKYHPKFRRWECLNEDLLLAYASNCDVLLVGGFVVLKETNIKVFPIIEEELKYYAKEIECSSYYHSRKNRAYFDEIFAEENHFGKQSIYDEGIPFADYVEIKDYPESCATYGSSPPSDFEDRLLNSTLTELELMKHKERFKPAYFPSYQTRAQRNR